MRRENEGKKKRWEQTFNNWPVQANTKQKHKSSELLRVPNVPGFPVGMAMAGAVASFLKDSPTQTRAPAMVHRWDGWKTTHWIDPEWKTVSLPAGLVQTCQHRVPGIVSGVPDIVLWVPGIVFQPVHSLSEKKKFGHNFARIDPIPEVVALNERTRRFTSG